MLIGGNFMADTLKVSPTIMCISWRQIRKSWNRGNPSWSGKKKIFLLRSPRTAFM